MQRLDQKFITTWHKHDSAVQASLYRITAASYQITWFYWGLHAGSKKKAGKQLQGHINEQIKFNLRFKTISVSLLWIICSVLLCLCKICFYDSFLCSSSQLTKLSPVKVNQFWWDCVAIIPEILQHTHFIRSLFFMSVNVTFIYRAH